MSVSPERVLIYFVHVWPNPLSCYRYVFNTVNKMTKNVFEESVLVVVID